MKRLLILGFLFGITLFSLPSCQKELSTESDTNNASFSLVNDSSKECLITPEAEGNYYNGVRADLNGNFVTVVVNVKSTGSYAISTGTNNGFSFYDSGFFSNIGLDTLVLLPRGKPILIEATDFSFGDSTCPFTVDVQDSTGTGLGGVDTSGTVGNGGSSSYVDPSPADDNTWHFTDSTNNKTYSGPMLPATLQSTGGLNVLGGNGTVKNNTNEVFNFTISLPSATIATGSYPGGTANIYLANVPNSTFDYTADGSATEEATDPSSLNITSYDASANPKRLKISFRCWATDANSKSALIKGSLNTTVQ